MTHKAPGFAERNLFFSDRVQYRFHLVELTCYSKANGHASVTTTERYLHISPDAGSSQFIDF